MDSFDAIAHYAMHNSEIQAVILAAVFSVIGWIAVQLYVGRGVVAWAVSHQHAFHLINLNPAVLAYTKELWVQNVGRSIAEDIEIVLAMRPQHFDIWPQRHYEELTNPDGSLVLKIDNLNRREYLTVSIFQTAIEPPMVTNVRWRGGIGRERPMGPQQVHPRWYLLMLSAFLIFGFFSFWYFLFRYVV